jgi:flagellar hook-associated protein 2
MAAATPRATWGKNRPERCMGRISSNVGLISGVPITDTVDKLIALQARARDQVVARAQTIGKQQVAVTELSALLLAFEFTTNNLGKTDLYQSRSVTSSNPTVLSATSSGQPPLGTYQFTPVQTVQSQQLLSSGVASSTAVLGGGSLSFGFGGFVDDDTSLDLLGGGAGLTRGKLRITDRSGASAEVDLRYAKTVDDVIRAVNENSGINVRLEAHGDRLQLVDQTGLTLSNLKVQEIGAGTTAASLGLAGIDVAASQAEGSDVVRLFNGLDLNRLNDGAGLRFNSALPDLEINFRDGSSPLAIDFRKLGIIGTQARGTTTAAAGPDAQIAITADTAGSAYDGVAVVFHNDDAVTAGNETVAYDSNTKTLTVRIDAGNTTANQVIEAINKDANVNPLFTASRATGSSGAGLVSETDIATLTGPSATATTAGAQGANAKVLFTAVNGGAALDNVTIEFVDNAGVTAGGETVAFDDSDPLNKRLTFQIDAGNTTAANIIDALNNDPAASQVFRAAKASGSDGSGLIDVADTAVTAGGALVEPKAAGQESTLADVLATLNTADPARLRAEISASGDQLVLTDLTAGVGSFSVAGINGSQAAADLGLTAAASGGTITSRRLLSGLGTTLLTSFNGGAGLGTLGSLTLTDRSGATANVDLSTAETLEDVLDAINSSGLGITAAINAARNGIELTDTTGATASNLIVADGDATGTAGKLGLAINSASATSVNSGSLKRRTVSENTRLATLNGGAGVAKGTLKLFDSNGASATLNLGSGSFETVGDVIDQIDRLGLAIDARINDAGDGILLVDTGGGPSSLKVTEGSSTAAADLHLLGDAKTIDIGGTPTKVIDGTTTLTVTLTATDTLQSLAEKINALGGGVSAGIFNDGSGINPARLTLLSQRAGRSGELLIDSSQLGLTFEETARAQDALLLYGGTGGTGGILATSSSSTFKDVVPGITLSVLSASSTPVSVTVAPTDTNLIGGVQATIDNYNKLRTKITGITAFDAEKNQKGVLHGDGSVLRVDTELSNLLSGRFFGAGSIQSLETLGISLKDDGTLEFDPEKLRAKFAENPDAVKEFFTAKETGFSARLKKSLEQLAGEENSLLNNRLGALARKVEEHQQRVEFLTARLDKQRELLLNEFFRMESAIAKIQASLGALGNIAPLAQAPPSQSG